MNTLPVRLVVALSILTAVAACSAGAPAPPAPSSPAAVPSDPLPTDVPGGNGGTGLDGSAGAGGGGAGVAPDAGSPQLVVPKPGTRDPRPAAIETLDVRVDGRRATAVPSWWSGVEPCTILDSVEVARDGDTFSISVREGSGPGDVACIELALLKATEVDLGELQPGEYTIVAADGRAAPIRFTVG